MVVFEDEHDETVGLNGDIDGPVYDAQSPFIATYSNSDSATLVFHTDKRSTMATLCANTGCTGNEQTVPNAVYSDNSENMGNAVVITYSLTDDSQQSLTDSVFIEAFPGTRQLTFTVTDPSGNVNSCVRNVKVVDLERPRIQCPRDFTYFDPTGETLDIPNWTTISGTPTTPQPFNFHFVSIDGAKQIRVKWDSPNTYDNIEVDMSPGAGLAGTRNDGAFVNGALSSYTKCDNAGPIDESFTGSGCIDVNPVSNELFQVRSLTGGATGAATRANNIYNITYTVQDSSNNVATCDFSVSMQGMLSWLIAT